ncbi:PaaI family thioesterase [Spongiibacter taiwanensis]|uniref:PaaI family thioesterase n=1 Tax=Spongiibacter taiwanensis TaxID=1748242 RepID=UPI0020365B0B|nr:PaaI family thioesterase [Spongiibacter taiwanensis]USA41653.1 PaaI family thioesterase [Spongiibacter taiwanensis]
MTTVTVDSLNHFLGEAFPQTRCRVESLDTMSATIRHPIGPAELRPGGTVSGPTLMAAADLALYAAVLGEIGLQPLAVTTNLNIHFLRKPAADRDIIARCELLKCGRTLAIGNVLLYSEGMEAPVAQASGTYAIPPKR